MTFSSEVHSRESSFQDPWSVVGRTVTYRSWKNVAHAEKLWKEAESKKPGLRARMTGARGDLGSLHLRKAPSWLENKLQARAHL